MKVKPAIEPEHGSTVLTRDGVLALVIGIPRPPGLIPVIPKYTLCQEGLWSRAGSSFCRILERYGPLGLSDVLSRIGFREQYDGVYKSRIPYVRDHDVIYLIKPRSALDNIISKPSNKLHYTTLELLDLLAYNGVEVENVGLTGSLAMGIENPMVSDVDLIVYGLDNSEIAYHVFNHKLEGSNMVVEEFSGLKVIPGVNLKWRRAAYRGFLAGWTGVPGVGELCEPLRDYFKINGPLRIVDLKIEIRGGQVTALTYPPCVVSRDGTYIVSFEYNVGTVLYQGGYFKIRGLTSVDSNVIYIATREEPGYVRILG